MAMGPGRYTDAATKLLLDHDANAAVVIVVGGTLGSGFDVSFTDRSAVVLNAVAHALRAAAQQMDRDAALLRQDPDHPSFN